MYIDELETQETPVVFDPNETQEMPALDPDVLEPEEGETEDPYYPDDMRITERVWREIIDKLAE